MFRPILFASLLAGGALSASTTHAQVYAAKTGTVRFYSHTPVEDIEAQATNFSTGIALEKRQLIVSIPMKSFVFKKALMQEHFLENYVEADKYPEARFTGTLSPFDAQSSAPQQVTATGELTIHGVSQPRTITGTLRNVKGKLVMDGEFTIALADHKVEIPSAVTAKIAEQVKVSFHSELARLGK